MGKDTPKNKDSSRAFHSHQKFIFWGGGLIMGCLHFSASVPSQLDPEKGRVRRAGNSEGEKSELGLRLACLQDRQWSLEADAVAKRLCTTDEQETDRDPKQHSALCPFLSSLKQKILYVCDIFTKDKNE